MLPKGSPGAFCVSASFRQGKALVLKDNGMFRGSIAVVSADIFAAEVDLISDTFALAIFVNKIYDRRTYFIILRTEVSRM